MKGETPLDDFPRNLGAEQLMALDRVMAIAEFELDGTLRHANANYLQLFGLSPDMAQGRKHRSFCPQALLNSDATAPSGRICVQETLLRSRGAHTRRWPQLLAGRHLFPVFNAQGQVQHIQDCDRHHGPLRQRAGTAGTSRAFDADC
jgi:PAS domain-containing protein